jgi:hypothetical protein
MRSTVKSDAKHLSDTFHIQKDLKEGALSTFLLNFAFEFAVRKVKAKQGVQELNETYQLLLYADDIYLLGEHIFTKQQKHRSFIRV